MIQNYNSQINFTSLPKFQIKVDERLVRGRAVMAPWNLYRMKKERITQVIDLRNSAGLKKPVEKLMCKIFGIRYLNYKYPHRLSVLPDREFFDNVNKSILENLGKTYIHCQYGKRRTGICTAIYEKLYTQKSKNEILHNLLSLGFMELKDNRKSYKIKKLTSIYNDFLRKYYPEDIIKRA